MKIEVKKSITEKNVYIVSKEEISKYIKSLNRKTFHIIDPNSTIAFNRDYGEKYVLDKIKTSDRTAIVTGDAAKNNLFHSLSIVMNDYLILCNIGELSEDDFNIIEYSKDEREGIVKVLLEDASKKKVNICKNNNCYNERQHGSSYCEECSNKHNSK